MHALSLVIFRTIGTLFIIVAIGLFFDSTYFAAKYTNGQTIATIGGIAAFLVMYYRSNKKLREQMIYAVIIGFLGEHLFSIIFKMYTYRLGNVPIYVPFGHAILYRVVANFCKKPLIILYRKQFEKTFVVFIVVYSTLFLVFANDIFGFIMSILVILILSYRPKDRLFYYSMYFVVCYLEIIGTTYQCWSWPKTFCSTVSFLQSANPPSGISLLYFLLDLATILLFNLRHLKGWKRMRRMNKLQQISL